MRSATVLILLLAVAAGRGQGQAVSAFDPFPEGGASYRFDLARNFFPTDSAATEARRRVMARLSRLGAAAAEPVVGAEDLLRLLLLSDSLLGEVGRLSAYYSLRGAIDTRDAVPQRALSELGAVANPALAGVTRLLGELDETTMNRYLRERPELQPYRYAHARARRDRQHRLDDAAEQALAAGEEEATSWGPALFQTTLASTAWGSVPVPGGALDFRRQGNEIRNHPDRSVRAAGYRLGQAGIASRRDTYALILTRQAAARNTIARQRLWPDYPSQAYAAGELQPHQVRQLLDALAGRADVNRRYERARISEIKRAFGYDSVHVWDLTVPAPGTPAPRFTIGDATREILASTEPLGRSYRAELRALLDPANGRLDLVARENRVDRPGFSTGSVGYPSMFFQGRFEGFLEDVSILAHEAGHAVQNMLMDSAGVLPRYAAGPSYFTESFAGLSEVLLFEHLYRSSRSRSDRRYYLRRLLDHALEMFRTGWESLVEQAVYDSVAAGRMLDADGVERLTQQVASRFSIWFGPGSERTDAWVQPTQFYTRPLYRHNYVVAKLLALQYLDLLRRDPAGFQQRYTRLLSNGYDASPQDILGRILDLDFTDPADLVDPAVRVIEGWLTEYTTEP